MTNTQHFYRITRSLGVDPVPATEQAPTTVARKTPSQQALSLMSLAALPWLPVAAGAWVGDKYGKKGWGALAGFSVSFFTLYWVEKASMAGRRP